jgi:hypothetical protein
MTEQSDTSSGNVEPPAPRRRGRKFALYVLLVVAGLLLLLSSFAVWINRVALNTGVFVDTSSELIQDDEIRRAVAQRAVDELYANVDVEAVIEERLPDDVKSLAGPTAAGLRQVAPEILDRGLEQPALERIWEGTLRRTQEELVDVLEGGGTTVSTEGGVVTLDLRELVLEAADRIGIRSQVDERLPEDAGRIEVLRSDELDTAQNVFQLLKTLAWFLPLLTLAAFGGAVWLAPDRRRALRGIGITIFVVGALGLLAANLTGNYVVNSLVAERDSRPAADNAWDILTQLMRSSFRWLALIGILFVVAAWLAGPGRRAIAARRSLAPVLRERVWPYVGLALIALILLLTGEVNDLTRFLVIIVLIGLGALWIELMRSRTMHEFPGAGAPAFVGEARGRVSDWWEARRKPEAPAVAVAPAAEDTTARLASLADLHARGELTDEEYAAAKARVLGGE